MRPGRGGRRASLRPAAQPSTRRSRRVPRKGVSHLPQLPPIYLAAHDPAETRPRTCGRRRGPRRRAGGLGGAGKSIRGFVAAIPSPLAMGSVQLDTGEWVSGFVCEPPRWRSRRTSRSSAAGGVIWRRSPSGRLSGSAIERRDAAASNTGPQPSDAAVTQWPDNSYQRPWVSRPRRLSGDRKCP